MAISAKGVVVQTQSVGSETLLKNKLKNKDNASEPQTFDRTEGEGGGLFDVVANNKYKWTLSNVTGRDDIPKVYLMEHRNKEPVIKRNLAFYAAGLEQVAGDVLSTVPLVGGLLKAGTDAITGAGAAVGEFFGNKAATTGGMLDVYREIFPDAPTNNTYVFPYFSQTYMELGTPMWTSSDDIGNSIASLAEGAGGVIGGISEMMPGKAGKYGRLAGRFLEGTGDALKAGTALAEASLGWQYPVVGVFDRPRMFAGHSERSLTIEFPLYNTINEWDWVYNRDLVYQLMTQFLYIKQSFITGIPPVFYRVHVPNQYYSFASCVTNFNVKNLGNIHSIDGYFVPDAFQVQIVLTEMCMPSLNQFQALVSGEALGQVEASSARKLGTNAATELGQAWEGIKTGAILGAGAGTVFGGVGAIPGAIAGAVIGGTVNAVRQ